MDDAIAAIFWLVVIVVSVVSKIAKSTQQQADTSELKDLEDFFKSQDPAVGGGAGQGHGPGRRGGATATGSGWSDGSSGQTGSGRRGRRQRPAEPPRRREPAPIPAPPPVIPGWSSMDVDEFADEEGFGEDTTVRRTIQADALENRPSAAARPRCRLDLSRNAMLNALILGEVLQRYDLMRLSKILPRRYD